MTRTGSPQFGLTALLDALERELLAAQADEVPDALRESGRARNIACYEIRALLDEAIAESEDVYAATLPPDICPGLHRLLGFSREHRLVGRGHPRISGTSAWSCRRH